MEIRKLSNEINNDGNTLSGYAILFGVESRQLFEYGKKFVETIERGAFDLEETPDHDIKLYFNHDTSMPLARQKGGSLRLYEDSKGIRFEAKLPDTNLANDVKELMKRGILTGEMSFGFTVSKDRWEGSKRTVEKGKIYEISVVTDAAYPATHSQLRSIMSEINNKRINLLRRRTK